MTRDDRSPVRDRDAAERRPRRRAPDAAAASQAWVAHRVALLVVGGIGGAVSAADQWAQRDALDPDSAGPAGTRALVEILRDHGVDVVVARDRAAAVRALAAAAGDPRAARCAGAVGRRRGRPSPGRADDVVLIEPRSRTLDLLLPGRHRPASRPDASPVEPDCDVPDAVRAGAVGPGRRSTARATAQLGLLSGRRRLRAPRPRRPARGRVAAVDGGALFTNEHLAENGNAALALNLMGRHPLVVWYVPGAGRHRPRRRRPRRSAS